MPATTTPARTARMLVQVDLAFGTRRMTCNVEHRSDLRAGCEITLKNSSTPDRRWRVLAVGAPRPAGSVHATFSNDNHDRHTGLDLDRLRRG